MEELFLAMMERLGQKMPELRTIDEDYGQLAHDENRDAYPVVFPCALFGNIEVNWTEAGPAQQGTGTFTVRLAIDCYDDTHLGSGTEEKIAERLRMHSRLCRTLHNYQHSRKIAPLERKRSVDYTLQGPGNIKVYETVFSFDLVDEQVAIPL